MIRTIMASTAEIDDVDSAVSEIREQLGSGELLRNSIGIVSCYAEFVESGVVKALAEALPFEMVGVTTIFSGTNGARGAMLLSLTVMTSDDVEFAAGLTEEMSEADGAPIEKAYAEASAGRGDKPALMLSFVPLCTNMSGDFFVDSLNRASGGIPNFGLIAVDHNEDYHAAMVISGGEAYAGRYAFVLAYGAVSTKYYVATISSGTVYREKGVVTASEGNQLKTVNNLPVVDYLTSLGMKKEADGSITGINAFPFVVDYNDGTPPIVRVMFAFTPEGYAVCGGSVPVGATLSVGSISAKEVLETTENMLKRAIADKHGFMLVYSCIGRYFAQGYDPEQESAEIHKILNEAGVAYHLAYAGGEICPVYKSDASEALTNRSHNDTCVICAF